MLHFRRIRFAAGMLAIIGSLLTFNACQDGQQLAPKAGSTTGARLAADFVFFALTDNNQLVRLNTQSPGTALGTTTITGVLNNERLVGIDFRPGTGQLYGISNGSRLYIINTVSGVATPVGAGPITPAIMGDAVGFDFNPTATTVPVSGFNRRSWPC